MLALHMVVCHKQWKRQYIFINAYEGNLQASFSPLRIPTSVICHFSVTLPLPFPFLPVCPVLGFAQAPLNSVRTCRFCLHFTSGGCFCKVLEMPSLLLLLRQDSVYSAEYSFHLGTHTPWLYRLCEIHLWGVCQIWSPSVSKRAEKLLFHPQKFLLE